MAELVATKIGEVLPNVWLGTSIEDGDVVDRIDAPCGCAGRDPFHIVRTFDWVCRDRRLRGIHWAIVGGESGKSARPIREEWIDEIYIQCRRLVAFFKQWGTWGKDNKKRSKKANGREYRGQTWDEMPTAAQAFA
jgi:protein gp37